VQKHELHLVVIEQRENPLHASCEQGEPQQFPHKPRITGRRTGSSALAGPAYAKAYKVTATKVNASKNRKAERKKVMSSFLELERSRVRWGDFESRIRDIFLGFT